MARVDPVSLFGRCEDDLGDILATLEAETSVDNTYTNPDSDLDVGVVELNSISDAPGSEAFTSIEPQFWHPTAGGQLRG